MSDDGQPLPALNPDSPGAAMIPAIQQAIKEVAPELPNEKKARLVTRMAAISVSYQGPLPPPEELEHFARIIPNGADRMMKLVEDQTAHRIEIEKHVIRSQQELASRGQLFALVIGVFGMSAGAWVGYAGQPWLGGVLGGSTVVALTIAFITGRRSQDQDLEEKRPPEAMPPQPQREHQQGKKRRR